MYQGPAFELENVSKAYARRPALSGLSLSICQGEMFGFLGPNGAGKTTTIRILLGLLHPDAGNVRILEYKVNSSIREGLASRTKLGFLPDIARIDGGFKGLEWLDYLGSLQNSSPDKAYRLQVLDQLQLAQSELKRKVKTYSRGMRQKLAIVQALQHHPNLLILDEPTEGLDPLAKQGFFELLVEIKGLGNTVFFSSHVLSEVERLCDRVALIRAGKLVALDTIAGLRERRMKRVEVAFESNVLPVLELASLLKNFSATEPVLEGGRWRLQIQGEINPLLQFLSRHKIKDLAVEPAGLEDIFLSYYKE